MKLSKIKIGSLIDVYSEECGISNLTVNDVSGINIDKEFFEPSKQVGKDTKKYKIVPPNYFACNLMHVGRDRVIPIALNYSSKNKIVSPAYTVFKIRDNVPILIEYFFILMKCPEKDRYFWFHTDGSVRDGLSIEDFCNIELELPSIDIQQKYVNVYKAMIANCEAYEKGLDDLKLVCDAYIENLRKTTSCEEIRKYITKTSKNSDEKIVMVLGIGQNGFIEPQKKPNESLKNYKILCNKCICYAPPLYNIQSDAIHYYDKKEKAVCSPIYESFICDEKNLLAKYLILWLKRDEFKRYTAFHSGGVRNTFDYDLMEQVKIPIPSIEIQEAIANIYTIYWTRRKIYEKLKAQIKDLCPILIKGAIEEALKEKEVK